MDSDAFTIEYNSFFKKKRPTNLTNVQKIESKKLKKNHLEDNTMNETNTQDVSSGSNESNKSEITSEKKHLPTELQYFSFDSIKSSNIYDDLIDNHAVMVIVEDHQAICFKGRIKVQVLSGCVEINGHKIGAKNSYFDVYSPESNSFISIKNCNFQNEYVDIMTLSQRFVCDLNIDNLNQDKFENVKQFITKYSLMPKSSLLIFKKLDSKLVNYISYFESYKQLYENYGQKNSSSKFSHLGLYPVDVTETKKILNFTLTDQVIIDRIVNDNQNGKVILAYGGKDVGKSTFLRYLINSLLNTYQQVAFLDCDPGQCEFTLSGCVQLTLIKEPLLGPPHTHLQHNTQSCFYLGHLSPNDVPGQYLECIKNCFNYYQSLNSFLIPLIINTMGWNQGLGLCLLKEQISITRPNYVIQLNSKDANKNISSINQSWWESISGWPSQKHTDSNNMPNFELFTINRDSSESKTKITRSYSAKDHRTIATIAYFAELQEDLYNFKYFNHLKPYIVSWSNFAIHIPHVHVSHDEIFHILNASLVGLCVIEKKFISHSNPELPGRLIDNQKLIYRCVGFGIIRGIKMDTKEFYIITPEPQEKLNIVNLLVKGMLNVPLEFYYDHDNTTSSPYVTFADNLNNANSNVIASEPYQRKFLVHQGFSKK